MMRRPATDPNDDPAVREAKIVQAIRVAAVSMVLFDWKAARALLQLSNEQIGRIVKIRLMRVIGLSTALNLDLHSIQGQPQLDPIESKRSTSAFRLLCAQGKVLRTSPFCLALGVRERKLNKVVAAGAIFRMTIHGKEYYPAFFLIDELDRRDLAKVVRRLAGKSGWRKWDFFTSPNLLLDNLTPLQALMNGELKLVLRAAAAFVRK